MCIAETQELFGKRLRTAGDASDPTFLNYVVCGGEGDAAEQLDTPKDCTSSWACAFLSGVIFLLLTSVVSQPI
jgi:hypothetical protein